MSAKRDTLNVYRSNISFAGFDEGTSFGNVHLGESSGIREKMREMQRERENIEPNGIGSIHTV